MSFNAKEFVEPSNSSLSLRLSQGKKKRNDDEEIVSRNSSSRATDEDGGRNRSLTFNRLHPKQYNKSRNVKRKLDKEEDHGPLVLMLKRNRPNSNINSSFEEDEITSFHSSNQDKSELNNETTTSSPLKLSFKRNRNNGTIEFVRDVNLLECLTSDSDDENQTDYHYNGWANNDVEEIDECNSTSGDKVVEERNGEVNQMRRMQAEFNGFISVDEDSEPPDNRLTQYALKKKRLEQRHRNKARSSIENFKEEVVELFDMGSMDKQCAFCGAKYFQLEATTKNLYTKCCSSGEVQIPEMPPPTDYVLKLLTGEAPDSNIFQTNSRTFNNLLSMASVTLNNFKFKTNSKPAIRISGSIYHNIGPVLPADECPASFLQVFFHESQSNNIIYTENMSKNAMEMMRKIRQEIALHNQFIAVVKPLVNAFGSLPDYYIKLSEEKPSQETQNRVYNVPTCNEVSAILCGDTTDPYNCPEKRAVIIKLKSNEESIGSKKSKYSELRRIDSTSKYYDPLAYAITHLHGSFGFQLGLLRRDPTKRNNPVKENSRLTCLDYYSYRAHIRSREQDTLLYGSLMSQQYWVDMYVKIETNRLNYIRTHQDKIKAEIYQGLKDAVDREDANVNDMGRTIILPSSVTGCPRQMIQNFQDAMAVVAKYGKPSYFITFTCNPDWPEIREVMESVANDSTKSRADVNARVFKLKLNELLKDLIERGVLGQHVAHCYTIEFQKRGLPHAHILLIVKEQDKPKTADDYDAVVCAEIPDPVTQPELHKLVTQHIMHGPCGVLAPNPRNCPCCSDSTGDCTKRFPKEFIDKTEDSEDCFPIYRRRSVADGGRVFKKRINSSCTIEMSNQWVVPYNPYLLMKYKSHLNVEICCTVRSVKYIYKYIHKGPDMASFKLQQRVPEDSVVANPPNDFHNGSSSNVNNNINNRNTATALNSEGNNGIDSTRNNQRPIKRDEIADFVQGRYISPPEAFWRIFCFDMGAIYPTVQRLQVHLEGHNTVTFQHGNAVEAVAQAKDTTLMAFFKKVKEERSTPKPDSYYGINPRTGKLNKKAFEMTYPEFPMHYTFNKSTHEWTRRKTSCRNTIGRMYNVHELSGNGERYFLRLLLSTVVNKASFEELLIVEKPKISHSQLPLFTTSSTSSHSISSHSIPINSFCSTSVNYLSTNNNLNLTSNNINSQLTDLNLNSNNTNNIKVCNTYREVCNELGLIGDDKEWTRCLDEQCVFQSASELRYLFAMLLVYNNVNEPNKLYLHFKDDLSDDCKYDRVRRLSSDDYIIAANRKFCDADYNEARYLINNHILSMTHSEKDLSTYGIDMPDISLLYTAPPTESSTLLEDALNYEVDEQLNSLNDKLRVMNSDQSELFAIAKTAIDKYVEMVENRSVTEIENRFIYFVDAFGGAGKTFVFNAILNYVRSLGKVALAVSSSAISAILLTDGTTAHSRFKIPIPICKESFMNFSKTSQTAELLRQCTVIIWDEATMTQKKVFEAFDRSMKDLMGNNLTFGGKVVLMGGDFRQTLPVIKRAGRGGIVQEIIKNSWIWKEVKTMSLTINERVNQAQKSNNERWEMKEFADFLLTLGNDEAEIVSQLGDNVIRIPDNYVFDSSKNIGDLLTWMYSNDDEDDEVIEFCDKAILTPVNTDVDMINNIGISKMVGTMYELDSCNIATYDDPNARHIYPQEFLKQIGGSGFPPDKLKLKVGAPVMLLRNLDQKKGLCNGTRLKITQIGRFRLQAKIMSGSHVGKLVVIPRIELTPNDQEFPFKLTRRQFPIQLAFAMTINKAQGQSFKKVGIYLGKPVFTHGQLYVACSRCGHPKRTKLLIKQVDGVQGSFDGMEGIYTRNVVYREVLSL